ncbi:hypothetical protein AB1K89_08770 [Sporosarcina sp. 179-K 8C2 HS]|uniref:hypothetical protein n=1 Tax=Sporosarcina sp. 179-K 8C2 HS TaxID=3142387 RepID=UPI00399EF747
MTHHIRIEKNTCATISLILALVGFLFGIIPIIGFLLMPVWLLAFVFGVVGLFKPYLRIQAILGIVIAFLTFFYHISFIQGIL